MVGVRIRVRIRDPPSTTSGCWTSRWGSCRRRLGPGGVAQYSGLLRRALLILARPGLGVTHLGDEPSSARGVEQGGAPGPQIDLERLQTLHRQRRQGCEIGLSHRRCRDRAGGLAQPTREVWSLVGFSTLQHELDRSDNSSCSVKAVEAAIISSVSRLGGAAG
jgi:hypothetical protein